MTVVGCSFHLVCAWIGVGVGVTYVCACRYSSSGLEKSEGLDREGEEGRIEKQIKPNQNDKEKSRTIVYLLTNNDLFACVFFICSL